MATPLDSRYFVIGVAIAIRAAVGLHPYSGFNNPPMYGDYEAQRHWMEITVSLPPSEWYHNTTSNDLQYWGLDYPPLTAYHSWAMGVIAQHIEPQMVELTSSRGYETPSSKLFMRVSSLISEALVYFPAVLFLTKRHDTIATALLCLQPSIILIDHGHFQYNTVALGFLLWSLHYFSQKEDVKGAIAFCLALNFKQMLLYCSPGVFFYLLGRCFRQPSFLGHFAKLGATVILTFALLWLPFLTSVEDVVQVAHRIFPLARGLYEDKVASVWCTLSPVLKLKEHFPQEQIILITIASTLLGFLPACLHCAVKEPKFRNLVTATSISGLSFFLFSFQVHEKSILIPLVPIVVLSVHDETTRPYCFWFASISCFSMFPLLVRDGLLIPYVACTLTFIVMGSLLCSRMSKLHGLVMWLSFGGAVAIHLAAATTPPPARYPHLFTLAITSYSCLHFVGMMLYLYWTQFTAKEPKLKTK